MLTGWINKDDDALVRVGLVLRGSVVRVLAVVDTGFNGYLSVPRPLVERSGWRACGVETYELATGEQVEEEVFLGHVVFDGMRRTILAVRSGGSDVLVGTKLLAGRHCEFDYVTRRVRIRKVGK